MYPLSPGEVLDVSSIAQCDKPNLRHGRRSHWRRRRAFRATGRIFLNHGHAFETLTSHATVPLWEAQEWHGQSDIRCGCCIEARARTTVIRWQEELIDVQLFLQSPLPNNKLGRIDILLFTGFRLEPVIETGTDKACAVWRNHHRARSKGRYELRSADWSVTHPYRPARRLHRECTSQKCPPGTLHPHFAATSASATR